MHHNTPETKQRSKHRVSLTLRRLSIDRNSGFLWPKRDLTPTMKIMGQTNAYFKDPTILLFGRDQKLWKLWDEVYVAKKTTLRNQTFLAKYLNSIPKVKPYWSTVVDKYEVLPKSIRHALILSRCIISEEYIVRNDPSYAPQDLLNKGSQEKIDGEYQTECLNFIGKNTIDFSLR